MNQKYSVIVFDLGNVLIPFDYKPAINKLNEVNSGLGDKFWKFYLDNYEYHRSFERGDVSNDDFIEKMLSFLENRISSEDFCNLYSKIFIENIDVTSLLPILKQDYKLVLLSNTNEIHKEFGWKDYGFLEYFDKLILSHEVGAVKPEPAIYKKVEEYTGNKPEEHLFIDDVQAYVEGAKSCGWDAIWFTSYNDLVNELKEKEILR